MMTPNEIEDAADEIPAKLCIETLRFFEFNHLPKHLQAVSRPFSEIASALLLRTEDEELDYAQTHLALTHLLQAKDAAVRARLPPKPR